MENVQKLWAVPEIAEAMGKIEKALETTSARHAIGAIALYLAATYDAAERKGYVTPDGMEKFLALTKAAHEELRNVPQPATVLH